MELKQKHPFFSYVAAYLCGTIAGIIGTCIVQPFDTIKVRIQLYEAPGRCNFCKVGKSVIQNEGFFALYRGLDAAIIRQILFNTVRLGLYDTLQNLVNPTIPRVVWISAVTGSIAGMMGCLAACPADVALIRMQADATLPPEDRRKYKNIFHALYRITKTEGICVLWTAAFPSVIRGLITNLVLFAVFELTKGFLTEAMGPGLHVSLVSSLISSVFSTTLSLPFDNSKTALQFMKPDPETKELPYKGMFDYFSKTIRTKGPLVFFRGFLPYWLRIAPHVIVSLTLLDLKVKLVESYMSKYNNPKDIKIE